MGEYIKKDKLIRAFYDEMQSMKNTDRSEAAEKVFGILMRYVNSFEAADVQPVKHGRWLSRCEGDIYEFSECSECGNTESCETPYCAQCGARMGGEQNDT